MNTKFNPETDIIFSIDEKVKNKKILEASVAAVPAVAPASPVASAPPMATPAAAVAPKQAIQDTTVLSIDSLSTSRPPLPSVALAPELSIIFFEFQIPIFANWCQQNAQGLRRPYQLISDLVVLTSELKRKVPLALFLPFSAAPKAMEQLVGQITTKFPHVKVVLISLEPWVPEKIKELQLKYQVPGKLLHFAVWPMGALAIEEILSLPS